MGAKLPKLDGEARKALHKEKDRLAKDWDAKVLSYEELVPRTEQPSPVRNKAHILNTDD